MITELIDKYVWLKQLWNWVMDGGWKSFEVHDRNMNVKDDFEASTLWPSG